LRVPSRTRAEVQAAKAGIMVVVVVSIPDIFYFMLFNIPNPERFIL
jgi:hypothetical protein